MRQEKRASHGEKALPGASQGPEVADPAPERPQPGGVKEKSQTGQPQEQTPCPQPEGGREKDVHAVERVEGYCGPERENRGEAQPGYPPERQEP